MSRRFLKSGPLLYNRRLNKSQLIGRVGMVGSKQQLQGHAFAEKPGGNVGGGDAAGDIGVLVGVVETGQHDRVRQFLLMIAQILLYKMGHIIADAHKGDLCLSGRPLAVAHLLCVRQRL